MYLFALNPSYGSSIPHVLIIPFAMDYLWGGGFALSDGLPGGVDFVQNELHEIGRATRGGWILRARQVLTWGGHYYDLESISRKKSGHLSCRTSSTPKKSTDLKISGILVWSSWRFSSIFL